MLEKTTDELFGMLPEFINIERKFYHLVILKGQSISITYQRHGEFIGVEFLDDRYITSSSLRTVVINTIKWLYENDYVKYMPPKYEELYNEIFKTK